MTFGVQGSPSRIHFGIPLGMPLKMKRYYLLVTSKGPFLLQLSSFLSAYLVTWWICSPTTAPLLDSPTLQSELHSIFQSVVSSLPCLTISENLDWRMPGSRQTMRFGALTRQRRLKIKAYPGTDWSIQIDSPTWQADYRFQLPRLWMTQPFFLSLTTPFFSESLC